MELKDTYIEANSQLIDGCRKNKRSAQIRIYEFYYKAMYNSSYRIINDREEAEDIMQESFLDAFKKIETYQGTGSFGAWLKRIVVNKSIDHLRRRKNTFSLDEQFNEIEDTTLEDEEFVSNTFTRLEEIRGAIEKMPDHHKMIISLYLLEGYDHQEIAQILNITHNNVRARYFRAKKELLKEVIHSSEAYLKSLTN